MSFARLKGRRLAHSQRRNTSVSPRSSSLARMFRERDEERRLSCRLSRPLLIISLMVSLFNPFFRKHYTLTTTLDKGKIYSNHLHFLSYLLKCPVENGISKPLNLSIPPDTPTLERLRPSNFFSFAYTFKISRYAPETYTNFENLLLTTVSGGDFSSEP